MQHTEIDVAEVSVGVHRPDVRRALVERQRELLNEIQNLVREVREEGNGYHHHTTHLGDALEADHEDDLAFALIQMKGELLQRVNQAVRQFDHGRYGRCADCGDVIAASRLRALPFAVRCRDCEETREDAQRRKRVQGPRVPSWVGSPD